MEKRIKQLIGRKDFRGAAAMLQKSAGLIAAGVAIRLLEQLADANAEAAVHAKLDAELKDILSW